MVLEYGQITDENISSNELFPVTFTVEFYMENDILHYVDVSLLYNILLVFQIPYHLIVYFLDEFGYS